MFKKLQKDEDRQHIHNSWVLVDVYNKYLVEVYTAWWWRTSWDMLMQACHPFPLSFCSFPLSSSSSPKVKEQEGSSTVQPLLYFFRICTVHTCSSHDKCIHILSMHAVSYNIMCTYEFLMFRLPWLQIYITHADRHAWLQRQAYLPRLPTQQ